MWVNRNNRIAGMPSSTERRTIFTMAKILRQNVGGVNFTMAGCALTGVSPTSAADYVKQITLSDGDVIEDGMMMVVTFANGNSAGNAPNTKTIYSSDQVNYFEDDQLTIPFTLAPAGCYEIEYTGTANAYTYTDYPVFQVGAVTGPVCDYRGHITSGDLWEAGDSVQCMLKEGKFLLLGGSGGADIEVYDTLQDAVDDLPNLSEGQYVATKDTGSELSAPVDVVQSGNMHAVSSNAVAGIFGKAIDNTKFEMPATAQTEVTANCTGLLYINVKQNNTATTAFYENNIQIAYSDMYTGDCFFNNFTLLIRKGYTYKWSGQATIDRQSFIPFFD